MPEKETGENLQTGGEGQKPEDPKHRVGFLCQCSERRAGAAQAKGYGPCKQWLPTHSHTTAPSLLETFK